RSAPSGGSRRRTSGTSGRAPTCSTGTDRATVDEDVRTALPPTDLTGRVTIVTGAGSGIGRGIARVFGAAGATVVCAALAGPAAEETAGLVRDAGGVASAVTADVSRRQDVAGLVHAV